jgi:8-oxo-dGTP diphosphatase
MDIIKVACGLILKDNKIFICRRKPTKSLGGYWEFPGGKLEKEEKEEACLKRELQEELGMDVEVVSFFKNSVHNYGNFKIELIAYTCNFISSSFTLTDHDAFEWIETKDLMKWNLAPADVPIAEALMKQHN